MQMLARNLETGQAVIEHPLVIGVALALAGAEFVLNPPQIGDFPVQFQESFLGTGADEVCVEKVRKSRE
jgi:hypothetical protein